MTRTTRLLAIALSVAALTLGACSGGGGGLIGGGSQPLDQQLPDQAGGVDLEVEVQTADTADEGGMSVDEDFLDKIVELGGSRETVEVGSAGDPTGELGASLIAFRAPGVDTGRFEREFVAQVEEDEDTDLSQATVGGKSVYTGDTGFGTAYMYFRGDTLFYVFGEEEAAATLLSALP